MRAWTARAAYGGCTRIETQCAQTPFSCCCGPGTGRLPAGLEANHVDRGAASPANSEEGAYWADVAYLESASFAEDPEYRTCRAGRVAIVSVYGKDSPPFTVSKVTGNADAIIVTNTRDEAVRILSGLKFREFAH